MYVEISKNSVKGVCDVGLFWFSDFDVVYEVSGHVGNDTALIRISARISVGKLKF